MDFGPYGQDPLEFAGDAFTHALVDFSVRPGIEGPQVVLSWSPPTSPISRLMIRRKLEGYPVDINDGVLVLDEVAAPNTITSAVDVGEDLLDADAAMGAGRWWYYRAFVIPAPPALADQMGGEAVQSIVVPLYTTPWDVQAFDRFSVTVWNAKLVGNTVLTIETSPEREGPWLTLATDTLAPGESARHDFTDVSYNFIRVSSDVMFAAASIITPWTPVWSTGLQVSRPCYVFRSGRHFHVAWNLGHLPQFYRVSDAAQPKETIMESAGDDGELHALGIEQETSGPLQRFLRILLAEMDRVHAYLEAIKAWQSDPDEMPIDITQHVAFELGYPLEVGQRDLRSVRAEMLRIAGFWKTKGTVSLVESVCEQVLGCVVRVQTGAGRVMRVADPDLYDKPASFEDLGISG